MLKGIPKIISPELLKVLCEMGHGDEIVITDGNFPGASMSKNSIFVRADGHGVCELLEAILQLFPLDTYAQPLYIMKKADGDAVETPIWGEFERLVAPYTDCELQQLERYEFYERSKKAYAVLQTGESALYANIILKKGVI